MGLPMIQVLMIAARQISRPIADMVIKYGKNHPLFRNWMLIPLGRSLTHLSTRLKMKNLGLGKPVTIAPVSEAVALEQASEFLQQLVLFAYSVGVFASYYYYSKKTTPETLKVTDFISFKEENFEELKALTKRLERIERFLLGDSAAEVIRADEKGTVVEQSEHIRKPQFQRISSKPIDEASRVVLPEVNIVMAGDDS